MWLSSGEYGEYSRSGHSRSRATGRPTPRLPSMTPIKRLYGSYTAAVIDAQAEVGESPIDSDAIRSLRRTLRRACPLSRALKTSPLTETIVRLALDLPEPDRRFIWMAASRPVGSPATGVSDIAHSRSGLARTTLPTAVERAPSFRTYEAWRQGQPGRTNGRQLRRSGTSSAHGLTRWRRRRST